jgi:hypothetical protein
MTTTPEQHFIESWQADSELVFQQRESKLWPGIRHGSQNSLLDHSRFIGALEDDDDEVGTRHGDTEWSEIDHLTRDTRIAMKDKALPIDRQDIQMMGSYDPTNPYVMALEAYFGRWRDRKILAALGGIAYATLSRTAVNIYDAGESRLMNGDGTLPTAGSDFSDTTATNLTVTKITVVGNTLVDASIPEDDNWFWSLNAKNISVLLFDTTLTDGEMAAVRDIASRRVGKFGNFHFIVLPTSQFTVNATETDCIETYAWHRSAAILKTGDGGYAPERDIAPRKDKKNTKQIYMSQFCGGTRLQGPGVMKINLKYA